METQFIKLNMIPSGVNPCFHISQYDIGRSLGFIVYNGSEVVDLDSYTCTIEATRSDGVAITASVATDDNVGTFETTATMTNKADKYKAQFVIVDGNSNRIASLPFDMEVIKAAMDENAESIEEDASLYQQYTEAVQGAIAETNAGIQAEENARIAAVAAEATARANADTAEATARANAITAEAEARQTADNTLQTNINSEASTRATQDGLLQSQINQIIAPSGEAPSAAEVQNARIGADGVTYDTLGNAIRANDNLLMNNFDLVAGYANLYPDPNFTFLKDESFTGARDINYFIYKSINNAGGFVYSNGKAVHQSGGSGNKSYVCYIKYDKNYFGDSVTFGLNLSRSEGMSGNINIYIRFLDSNGAKIGTDVNKTLSTSGFKYATRSIDGLVDTIVVWVSSQSTSEWSFDSPILVGGENPITYGSQLWDIIKSVYTHNPIKEISFVSTASELISALGVKRKVYLLNNITLTSDLLITDDIEIDGLDHSITASSITSYVIAVQNARVSIINCELIGDQTKNYVIVPSNGSEVRLENCSIHTSYDSVVRCNSTSKVVIDKCDIYNSYHNDGVSPAGTADVRIYNSKMHDCYDEGVSSHNSSYTECHNCEAYNNGYEVGTKTKGATSSFGGIHIGGGAMGIVESCYSHDNCTYGIGLINFQEDLATDIEKCFNNLVENNGSHGIMCTYCKHLTLTNNSCIDNIGDAIHFGVDSTQSSPQGIISSGYVAGNIMFENGTDEVVIDLDAQSDTLHVQGA